ncbi:unnamed protein product [Blepharisma stoltei]|uniref:Uncharacterized protein n=1 Tax=Blepharisma stoltei TaxID=1481888 RepID=A0AAU9IGV5_9CILI|nr:unnamed protein product [Blepharisma stoltei]
MFGGAIRNCWRYHYFYRTEDSIPNYHIDRALFNLKLLERRPPASLISVFLWWNLLKYSNKILKIMGNFFIVLFTKILFDQKGSL